MKNLKFGVLLFGALGIVSLFMLKIIPSGFKADALNATLVLAGFVVPTVLAAMGISRPFERWMSAASAAGFALVFVRLKLWLWIKHIADVDTGAKILVISSLGGLIVSILCLAKPEEV